MIPIYPYQTQEVRDLAWVCFSPSLLLTQALLTQKSADDEQNITECGLARTPLRQASTNETDSHWNEWLVVATGALSVPSPGGVDTASISSETMEAKQHPRLFFYRRSAGCYRASDRV